MKVETFINNLFNMTSLLVSASSLSGFCDVEC